MGHHSHRFLRQAKSDSEPTSQRSNFVPTTDSSSFPSICATSTCGCFANRPPNLSAPPVDDSPVVEQRSKRHRLMRVASKTETNIAPPFLAC
ncbi:hypothetical protein BLNAU_24297 [Blattamonas nauphoetae]|uniref:Uncharacterized protein n=1 Tax=Blattamonas nauphoetae TaxID=2049346 RepID=A0ABQ9WNR7_9EUKA|nr:hypothetical protein BLNAU_24297 [Blattamonas nauphoetae]